MWPSLTVLDGKKRERLGPLEKRNQSGKKTICQPLLEKRKKQKQEKQEEEEEDMEEETLRTETSHRGEVQGEYQMPKTRKMKTRMTVSLVADRDQPVAKATSGTRKEQRVSEDSTDKQDKRRPVGRAKDSSATLGKRKGKCDTEEGLVPRKKQKTVHERDVMQNAPSATSSVAATDSPGPLSASVSGAGLLAAEQQGLKRGLKGSLKDMTKGRSGVVAVKDIRRKQKGRRSGGWDLAALSSGANVLQIGSGQMSTWT